MKELKNDDDTVDVDITNQTQHMYKAKGGRMSKEKGTGQRERIRKRAIPRTRQRQKP